MALWRRAKKSGAATSSVFDPKARAGTFQRPGLVLGGRQLPPITAPSFTDWVGSRARAKHPAGSGKVHNVITPSALTGKGSTLTEDSVNYLGFGGRAAVVLGLTPDVHPNLNGMAEAISTSGVRLYLDAHPGFVRASLQLPLLNVDLDTGMLLREGNAQEFLSATYTTETVELHIAHSASPDWLTCTCAAPGIRALLEAGFDLISQPAPADLRASLAVVNTGLNPAALIRLRPTGPADHIVVVTEV